MRALDPRKSVRLVDGVSYTSDLLPTSWGGGVFDLADSRCSLRVVKSNQFGQFMQASTAYRSPILVPGSDEGAYGSGVVLPRRGHSSREIAHALKPGQ